MVIPVYNRLSSLKDAIESVLFQTFKDFEIIIIDDCSDYVISERLFHYLPMVTVLRNEHNMGVSYSRNRGIKIAKGTYVALLDSDDVWLPFKLEYQINEIEKAGSLICHSDEFWYRDGIFVNKSKKHKKCVAKSFGDIIDICRISPSSVLMHRNIFNKAGYFDVNLRVCEDYDFWLRVGIYFDFLYLPVPTIVKRAISQDQLSKSIQNIEYMRLKILNSYLKKCSVIPFFYKYAVIKEIDRKTAIVKRGINKSLKTLDS